MRVGHSQFDFLYRMLIPRWERAARVCAALVGESTPV
jgi:hypothetical protein